MSDNRELEKITRIKKEVSRLNSLFRQLDKKKKKAVDSLIKNAAFMAVTLEDLQNEINENGVTEKYQNGANQFGMKKSSAVEVYNTMIKNHVQVMKQLTDLLPKEENKPEDDGFDAFVSGRDD
jgi:sugar-specific transcriptional regulator TrmB